jgi:hypothetical protein
MIMLNRKPRHKRAILILIVLTFVAVGLFTAVSASARTDWFSDGLDALTLGRYDLAIEAFTRSLETVPDDYEAYNNRGIAYSNEGLTEQAEADFNRAIELNPNFHDAYVNRGIERQKQGFIDSALMDYQRALSLAQGDSSAQLLLAWALATWPDERFRDGPLAVKLANGLIRPAAANNPWDLMAAAYAEAGQYENAVEAQRKYIDQLLQTETPPEEIDVYRRRMLDFKAHKPLRNWVMKTQPVDDEQAAKIMSMLKQSLGGKSSETVIALGGKSSETAIKKPAAGTLAKKKTTITTTSDAKTAAEIPLKEKPPSAAMADTKAADSEEAPPLKGNIESSIPAAAEAPPQPDGQAYPYVLTIASLRDEKLGLETTQKFLRKGDPAFSSWVYTSSSGKWYQIYIGWYPDKEHAAQIASALEKRRFRQVVISRAPLAVMIGDSANGDDLDALEAQLNTLGIVGYRLGGRLLVGAYKVKLAAKPLIEQLEKNAIAYQWVQR